MNAPALLTLAGFAALAMMVIVACRSRWGWHSPWVAVCLAAEAASLATAGATEGNWPAVAGGMVLAAATGRAAVIAARARHQVTVHGGETRRGRG